MFLFTFIELKVSSQKIKKSPTSLHAWFTRVSSLESWGVKTPREITHWKNVECYVHWINRLMFCFISGIIISFILIPLFSSRLWVRIPARPTFFPRIDKSQCDMRHSSSTNELSICGKAASCLGRLLCGVLVWKKQEMHEQVIWLP